MSLEHGILGGLSGLGDNGREEGSNGLLEDVVSEPANGGGINGCSKRNMEQQNKPSRRTRGYRVLKCATLNAQSLKNKMAELKTLVEERKPQIISVTESWGKDCVSDGIFSLPGYTMYRDDRNVKKGGEAIIYVNNKLEQRICRPLSTKDFENSVWCWVK